MDYDISVDGALNSFAPTLEDSEFNLIGKYNQIENLSDFEILTRIESQVLVLLHSLQKRKGCDSFNKPLRKRSNANLIGNGVRLKISKKIPNKINAYCLENYSRTWTVLGFVQKLLIEKQCVTQRDIFYSLSGKFQYQRQTDETIQNIVGWLNCPRACLNISASPKGLIAGCIQFKNGQEDIDCSKLLTGQLITEKLLDLVEKGENSIMVDAKYLLIIEKEAIFNRLLEDKIFLKLPCIILCGQGVPDLATRKIAYWLQKKVPSLLILGLFDWNLGGISIFLTYKCGSGKFHSFQVSFSTHNSFM